MKQYTDEEAIKVLTIGRERGESAAKEIIRRLGEPLDPASAAVAMARAVQVQIEFIGFLLGRENFEEMFGALLDKAEKEAKAMLSFYWEMEGK